jgi:DNA-binding beta-propeller fold protein YncE
MPVALDGSVWILAPDGPLLGGEIGPLVYRLDIETGEAQARIPIDGRLCQGLAAGFGSVWACSDAGLARIDPASNEVVATVPFDVAQAFTRPAIGADRVWMLGGNVRPDAVVEIDPASNEVVATHPIGHAGGSLAFGGDAVWITAPADGLVLRLDPETGEVTEHAGGLPAPAAIAYGAGSLWVALYGEHGGERAGSGEGTIARLAAADGTVEATIFINSPTMGEGDIWASDDAIWVRAPSDPFLVRIDPQANAVDYAIAGFHSGGALTIVDGVIWTTSIEFATAWRIEP